MIWENIKQAGQSLRTAKLRSFLTMLGIIIGVAAVTSVVAIGEGVKRDVARQVGALGANVVTVTPGQAFTKSDGGHTQVNPASTLGASTLTNQDAADVSRLPGVLAVAPLYLISGVATAGNAQYASGLIMATTPDYQTIRQLSLTDGRFLAEQDLASEVVVLGSAAKQALFGNGSAIGQTVKLRGQDYRVIGVMAASPGSGNNLGGPSFDSVIYLPVGSAQKLTGGNLQIFRILVQASSGDEVEPAASRINATLKRNHGGQEDFSVLTQDDIVGTVQGILSLLSSFIAAIAAISLLVGGVGIMNIMLVSVTERTREIGIRKALGATKAAILTQFLVEAVVISVIGGALGVALAFAQGMLTERLVNITPVFTWPVLAMAVGISAGIGIVFGLMPATKAASKRPIDALRYE